MANQIDVNTARSALQELWTNPPARDQRYGNALRSVSITNIRGLSINVELQWPVVAIGGINGCGKTTILQVCSAAYTEAGSGRHHYTLGRWIGPALTGESPPVTALAEIRFNFWDATPSLIVPYQEVRSRWGYPRRGNPERNVYFVGISDFAPRIERADRTHQNRARLNVLSTVPMEARFTESVSRILGNAYTATSLHTVSVQNAEWRDTVPQLSRNGFTYTEGHMGAGEQKVVRLVQQLEALPPKSLVLLEEPELTLHPDAQFGLAWYLMTLSRRKGHQIVIATHSPHIFEALPTEARVLLARDNSGVSVLHGVTHLSAARNLAASVRSNMDLIFVEDGVASKLLTEVFRRHASDLLRGSVIVPLGSFTDVQRMVAKLRGEEVRAVGVRDPDQGDAPEQGLFSLPGNGCPEQILLSQENVTRAETFLAGVTNAYDRALVRGHGYAGSQAHKRVFEGLCSELEYDADFVSDRLTLAWLSSPAAAADCAALVGQIRGALDVAG